MVKSGWPSGLCEAVSVKPTIYLRDGFSLVDIDTMYPTATRAAMNAIIGAFCAEGSIKARRSPRVSFRLLSGPRFYGLVLWSMESGSLACHSPSSSMARCWRHVPWTGLCRIDDPISPFFAFACVNPHVVAPGAQRRYGGGLTDYIR